MPYECAYSLTIVPPPPPSSTSKVKTGQTVVVDATTTFDDGGTLECTVKGGSSMATGQAKAHALRTPAGTFTCFRCGMMGPSPQSGKQECGSCKLCAVCCRSLTTCCNFSEYEGIEGAVVVETPHDYPNDMLEYWDVSIPDAHEGIEVRFDPKSRTEHNYDYVQIFKDKTHSAQWGKDKYTGGGTSSTFTTEPLLIPAKSFVVHFRSDGSGNDWGFKLVATKKAKTTLSTAAVPGALALCGQVRYEVTLNQLGPCIQLGWASPDFPRTAEATNRGTGDDAQSWAADGLSKIIWHNGRKVGASGGIGLSLGSGPHENKEGDDSEDEEGGEGSGEFPVAWAVGDVIGVAADLDEGTLSFAKNGAWTQPISGCNFATHGLFPSITLKDGSCRINLGGGPFKYPGPDAFYEPVSSRHTTLLTKYRGDPLSFHGSFDLADPLDQFFPVSKVGCCHFGDQQVWLPKSPKYMPDNHEWRARAIVGHSVHPWERKERLAVATIVRAVQRHSRTAKSRQHRGARVLQAWWRGSDVAASRARVASATTTLAARMRGVIGRRKATGARREQTRASAATSLTKRVRGVIGRRMSMKRREDRRQAMATRIARWWPWAKVLSAARRRRASATAVQSLARGLLCRRASAARRSVRQLLLTNSGGAAEFSSALKLALDHGSSGGGVALSDTLLLAAQLRDGYRNLPEIEAQAVAQMASAAVVQRAQGVGDGLSAAEAVSSTEFPSGASRLKPREKRCLEQATAAMIEANFADAERHLEALGDPSHSSWDHHLMYLALCLISGGSFVDDGEQDLMTYIRDLSRADEPSVRVDVDPMVYLVLARLAKQRNDAVTHRAGVCLFSKSVAPQGQRLMTDIEARLLKPDTPGSPRKLAQAKGAAPTDPLVIRWAELQNDPDDKLSSASMDELLKLMGLRSIKAKVLQIIAEKQVTWGLLHHLNNIWITFQIIFNI